MTNSPRAPQLGEGILCILEHLVEPDNIEPALTELDRWQLAFPEARPRVARPVGNDDVGAINRPAAHGRKTDERPGPTSNVQQGATARRQILSELTQLTFEVPLAGRVSYPIVWAVIRHPVDRGNQLLEDGPGTLELETAGRAAGEVESLIVDREPARRHAAERTRDVLSL